MKNTFLGINRWIGFLLGSLVLVGCQTKTLPQIEVQRPAKISVPKEVKKIFIREDMIDQTNDNLQIGKQVLRALRDELNKQGRFKVQIVNQLSGSEYNTEKETVGIIQGSVFSGGEIDEGLFAEQATCELSIAGIASSAVSANDGEQITVSKDGYPCKKGNLKSQATGIAVGGALTLMGVQTRTYIDEVVRTYRYKNISLYAQANFSLTLIGLQRATLAIRSDASSFGRHLIKKNTVTNVAEGYPSMGLRIVITRSKSPIVPILKREFAVIERTIPNRSYYNRSQLPQPSVQDLPAEERKKIVAKLSRNVLQSFVRTISPYRIRIEADIAAGSGDQIKSLLRDQKWQAAQQKLLTISDSFRTGADLYNLGLTYEGGAVTVQDYEEAKRLYDTALLKEPGNALYASGIGRMERRLAESRILQQQ